MAEVPVRNRVFDPTPVSIAGKLTIHYNNPRASGFASGGYVQSTSAEFDFDNEADIRGEMEFSMRSIWSSAISFGLIYIPVRLYTASDDPRLDLDMLRKGDLWKGVLGPGMDMQASLDALQASWSQLAEKLKNL